MFSNVPLSTVPTAAAAEGQFESDLTTIVDTSTLVLLEHININVPEHTFIVPFYYHLLGMGLDKRRAHNIALGKGTLWANCGASQFHLPYGETAQVVPGMIGLRYDSLEPLKQRLAQYDTTLSASSDIRKPFRSYTLEDDPRGQGWQRIKIVDLYGNIFLCRQHTPRGTDQVSDSILDIFSHQPNLKLHDLDDKSPSERHLLQPYTRHEESECKGIDFLQVNVPEGTADKIAEFYDCIFDATVSVLDNPNHTHDSQSTLKIAVVAFGKIDSMGRSSQSLIFQEISNVDPERSTKLKPYDGYHIALYVGSNAADFEQAFQNSQDAGIVWVNPRFSDQAMTLTGARTWKQFRFKHILDLETGQVLFQMEHEVRSVEHEAWPGTVLK